MPNWVQNNVSFSGDKAEIKEMLEKIKNDETGYGSIDFNKIIPMPESLNIECGSQTDKGMGMVKKYLESMSEEQKSKEGSYEEFVAELREHSDDISDEEEKKIWNLGVSAVDNIYRYGSPTWYEWSCKHWGTKWNACYCTEKNENAQSISFRTAWATPFPVILKLSEMFPNVEIKTEFADEDIGQNCGEFILKGGELVSMQKPETNKEALELFAKVWNTDLGNYSLHINQTGTDYVYTDNDEFELVELFGKPALFTNQRLTADKVPQGLNLYHLRISDDGDRFASIEPKVTVNHGGSVITNENIDFGDKGYISFTDETEPNFIGGDNISIDDYVTENFTMDSFEEQSGGMNLCQ